MLHGRLLQYVVAESRSLLTVHAWLVQRCWCAVVRIMCRRYIQQRRRRGVPFMPCGYIQPRWRRVLPAIMCRRLVQRLVLGCSGLHPVPSRELRGRAKDRGMHAVPCWNEQHIRRCRFSRVVRARIATRHRHSCARRHSLSSVLNASPLAWVSATVNARLNRAAYRWKEKELTAP